ncbi:MAG: RIP metalloprotease RseP [Candidatus Auribacterota bacterium]|jgi:regulator of sigma E protease|nr:RIP metalloprotease RseP [Candidatus Auribacterota bacterium]
MELIINLVRFIIILGVLIFIHELGHFMVAKKVGIYVFRFSIGFGKRLFGFRIKETDYCISAIPFGGYVKMAGQEDMPSSNSDDDSSVDMEDAVDIPEDQKFYNKTVWQRFAVVCAGPAMNFLLGLIIFIVVYTVGIDMPAYMKSTTIGEVLDNSPAMSAGLQPGDTILAIDGDPIEDWKAITRKTIFSIDEELTLDIKRGNDVIAIKITPSYYDEKSNPGIGILPYIKPVIKEVMSDSPASLAGLQENDIVIAVNGHPASFTNVITHVKYAEGSVISLTVLRNDSELQISVNPDSIGFFSGMELAGNIIFSVDSEKYPNLKAGDSIVKINGIEISPESDLSEILTGMIGRNVELTVQRNVGTIFARKSELITAVHNVSEGNKIGVYFQPDTETTLEKYPVHTAIVKGTKRTFGSVFELFASLYYLVIGKIKARELAGPVGIYKITSDFARSGFMILLSFVAFLSVNLSVINLLPIPVLDGGHVVFLLIEGIRRKPLNEKIVETCQKIGFILLMALIIYTLYNDIVHRLIGN